MDKQKNFCVEALRFLFIMQICLWHTCGDAYILKHGDLAVEFFFMLSGIFLYKSVSKPNALGSIDYTVNKLKKYLPTILLFFPVLLLFQRDWIPSSWTFDELSKSWNLLVGELFNIGKGGLWGFRLNQPLWYLSVLIMGGGYYLLSIQKLLPFHVGY